MGDWVSLALCLGIGGAIAVKLYAMLSCGRYRIRESLAGTSVFITGGTSGCDRRKVHIVPPQLRILQGIGEQTVKALAAAGARVHVGCRDVGKGGALVASLPREYDVELWEVDVAERSSVQALSERWHKAGHRIHILINNAGVGGLQRRCETSDGNEVTMATNFLGPFLLTRLLLGEECILVSDLRMNDSLQTPSRRRAGS